MIEDETCVRVSMCMFACACDKENECGVEKSSEEMIEKPEGGGLRVCVRPSRLFAHRCVNGGGGGKRGRVQY